MNAELLADGSVELTLEREFRVTPEKVFNAWLDPEKLAVWMGPSDDKVTNITTDPVVGGNYHMDFCQSDGTIMKLNGSYKTINRFSQLIFTWTWELDDPSEEQETLVTVNFEKTERGTRMILIHKRFRDGHQRDMHNQGWTATFDKLEARAEEVFS